MNIEEDKELFSKLDHFFTKTLLSKTSNSTEETRLFLNHLMAVFRQGHLCLKIDKTGVYPSLALTDELQQKVIQGSDFSDYQGVIYKNGNCYYLQKNWFLEKEESMK